MEPNEYMVLALQGRNIEAIKLYKERHGCGLKEAKTAFEDMVRDYFKETKE